MCSALLPRCMMEAGGSSAVLILNILNFKHEQTSSFLLASD